jgi:GT2 family glycosyltransferase
MLTLNQRETTCARCSVMPQMGPGDRVLVWDNGSSDGTKQAVAAEFPTVTVHHHPENLGVASGRNAGAKLADRAFRPEYLLFLDNDLVLQPGFVQALLDASPASPARAGAGQAALFRRAERINDGGGCRINFWLGRTTDPVGFKEIDRGQCEQVAPCVSCGGAMMVRARLFRELGGFDSIFDPFGPEDLDFSLRLQALGYQALYIPQAVALHEVNHTFESGGYSAVYARSKAKHWLRFLRRHGTPLQKAGFFAIGAPLIATRMTFRELRRGEGLRGAIVGSVRGMIPSREPVRREQNQGWSDEGTGHRRHGIHGQGAGAAHARRRPPGRRPRLQGRPQDGRDPRLGRRGGDRVGHGPDGRARCMRASRWCITSRRRSAS